MQRRRKSDQVFYLFLLSFLLLILSCNLENTIKQEEFVVKNSHGSKCSPVKMKFIGSILHLEDDNYMNLQAAISFPILDILQSAMYIEEKDLKIELLSTINPPVRAFLSDYISMWTRSSQDNEYNLRLTYIPKKIFQDPIFKKRYTTVGKNQYRELSYILNLSNQSITFLGESEGLEAYSWTTSFKKITCR